MAIPLVTGGLVVISLLSHDMAGLAAPFSLLFYGLALYGAGSFHTEPSNFWGSWKSCSVLSAHVLSAMGCFVGQSALARCMLSMGWTSIIARRGEASNTRTIHGGGKPRETGHQGSTGGEGDARLQCPKGVSRRYGRDPRQPHQSTRKGAIHRRQQIVCRTETEYTIFYYRRRQISLREAP